MLLLFPPLDPLDQEPRGLQAEDLARLVDARQRVLGESQSRVLS